MRRLMSWSNPRFKNLLGTAVYSCAAGFIGQGATATTILDLQPLRQGEAMATTFNGVAAKVVLTGLNPRVGAWYTLQFMKGASVVRSFHLEVVRAPVRLSLSDSFPNGIMVVPKGEGVAPIPCPLWGGDRSPLTEASQKKEAYVALCEGQVYLRNPTEGRESTLERTTSFLRRHVWGGDALTNLVKSYVYLDHFLLQPDLSTDVALPLHREDYQPHKTTFMPPAATVRGEFVDARIPPEELGLKLKGTVSSGLAPGAWYSHEARDGVFISAIEARMLQDEVMRSHPDRVRPLDDVEGGALVYLVAFDLERYELGFALGTAHPSVEWSERVAPEMRDSKLPGPDGIGRVEPVVPSGIISPRDAGRTVATFTGGFKREHGAFKWGPLAKRQQGSHYGFIEQGVVFSRLIEGLATLVVRRDGTLEMGVWGQPHLAPLDEVKHARQNGVAIIESRADKPRDPGIPGEFVDNWEDGNWSGSQSSKQRALRAGACIVHSFDHTYLVYGYFSSATPNAMARVFQAYSCSTAMHLDMNALEHTYLAVFGASGGNLATEHLISGMSVLDQSVDGRVVPRFIGIPDNRDFFYVMDRQR